KPVPTKGDPTIMTVEEQIQAALQGAQPGATLVDPRTGRTLLVSLTRALGSNVEDETDYRLGRAYRFAHSVRSEEERRWRTVLHVDVCAAGPFATHTFILRTAEERWWSRNIRTSRVGFHPEDAEVIARLRAWYEESSLTEVEPRIQALPAPPALFAEGTTLFQALFRP
ncbi:MAG TPA: hypothetical protein VNT01_04550, partial [Symbiobacteriaceae bacterium]|nr:hypothetical protein [Symbiobacteriaceae bacterium]